MCCLSEGCCLTKGFCQKGIVCWKSCVGKVFLFFRKMFVRKMLVRSVLLDRRVLFDGRGIVY